MVCLRERSDCLINDELEEGSGMCVRVCARMSACVWLCVHDSERWRLTTTYNESANLEDNSAMTLNETFFFY